MIRPDRKVYSCESSLRLVVMTMPATDPKSRRMRSKNALNYELYDWHFRVITYDSPIGTNSVEINY